MSVSENLDSARGSARRASPAVYITAPQGNFAFLRHHENVYSYFKFIVPVEDKKAKGGITWTKILAYVLVICSIMAQFTLLYAIFERVVKGDVKWQNKILNPQGDTFTSKQGHDYQHELGKTQCMIGGSLCFKTNGTVSCAPPSVQLTGRWDELDTNGDGIWTREEVIASKDELQCKYAVNPVEVFDVFVNLLKDREGIIWLHPDVKARRAIPKPYFTYAAGDIIMCGYRSTDMCANVLQMGAFDAPLKTGLAPRVGKTIDSALDYCYDLLKVGGTCERTLPSTYAVWRKNGEEQCGDPDFDKFVYTHPESGMQKSMLVVDYDSRKAYERAHSSDMFIVYKSIVIGLFLLAMFNEFKGCMNFFNWVIMFPSANGMRDPVLEEKDPESDDMTYTVKGITTFHRFMCTLLALCRLTMCIILAWVGLSFLLKDTTYIDLLLNAVGFVFIVEIAEYLYCFFIDAALRDECDRIEAMQVPQIGFTYLHLNPALRDILGVLGLIGGTAFVMYLHHSYIVTPLSQALECTCLGRGSHCLEAQKFTPDFWSDYWTVAVPGVFKDIAEMKAEAGVPETPLGLLSPSPALESKIGLAWHVDGKMAETDDDDVDDAAAPPKLHVHHVRTHTEVDDEGRQIVVHRRGHHHHHHGHHHLLNGAM
jgi:arginine exporter protein ArgO